METTVTKIAVDGRQIGCLCAEERTEINLHTRGGRIVAMHLQRDYRPLAPRYKAPN